MRLTREYLIAPIHGEKSNAAPEGEYRGQSAGNQENAPAEQKPRGSGMAVDGAGVRQRNRGGARSISLPRLHGNQFHAVSGKAVMRTAGRPERIRRREMPFRLDRPVTGEVRRAQPSGGVRPGPSAHVVAVCGDPGRGGGIENVCYHGRNKPMAACEL